MVCSICGGNHNRNNSKYHTKEEIEIHDILMDIVKKVEQEDKSEKKDKKEKKYKKNALDNEINMKDEFNSSQDLRENLSLHFKINVKNGTCYKVTQKELPNDKLKQTDKWNQYKKGSEERGPTSKADLCIKINDLINDLDKITISLKSGCGRLTSADVYEFSAQCFSVIDNNEIYFNNENLKKEVNDIINLMKNLGKFVTEKGYNITEIEKNIEVLENDPNMYDSVEWIKKFRLTCCECNKKWKNILEKYPEFVKDLLFECASGKYKFGENIGKADWLIVTESSSSTDIKYVFSLKKRSEELDNYLLNCIPKEVIKGKSSGCKLWCRFL